MQHFTDRPLGAADGRRARRRRRRIGATALLAGLAATAAIAVPSGSAQAPAGATTLSFYEPDDSGTFKLIDTAPKSPATNPGSSKYRFSMGDEVLFSSALFDKKGGTRLGTLYVHGTVVKGNKFSNMLLSASGTYVLTDGSQISVLGIVSLSQPKTSAPIVGGTGRYEGARGHLESTSGSGSSTDVLTLLP